MIFQYRCTNCRMWVESTRRGDSIGMCPDCIANGQVGWLNRKWSIAIRPTMPEHFNHTTQTRVTSMAGFKSDLKRAEEAYSERTGQSADFQPRDWQDLHTKDYVPPEAS